MFDGLFDVRAVMFDGLFDVRAVMFDGLCLMSGLKISYV